MRESIEWRAVADEMPDADETVLLFNENYDQRVLEGRWDGEEWRAVSKCLDDPVLSDDAEKSTMGDPAPTHWALWPNGPEEEQ